MPDLYYGPYGDSKKPLLYVPGMRRVESQVFDSFKLVGLAPACGWKHIANFWRWLDKKHTVISWHETDNSRYESSVFIPSLMDQREALEYARTVFPEVMPSPITFRFFQGYDEALLWD